MTRGDRLTPAAVLRLVVAGMRFHVKSLTTSSFFILTSVLQPVIFATIAFFMFRAGGRGETLLYAALGAGLMGIWSSTLFGSGGAIQWQRWEGVLEILVAAPAPFVMVLLPLTLSTSFIGIYSLTSTLLWGWLFFRIPLEIADPLMFALAIPATVLGLGFLGLLLASTFVLYRQANALSNLLEYPVWLVTGLLVPVALLPAWVAPISWVLAPTWGMRAIRGAALGDVGWLPVTLCVVLGAVYLVGANFALRKFEVLACRRATLSLT